MNPPGSRQASICGCSDMTCNYSTWTARLASRIYARSGIDVAFDVCERVNDDPRGEAYAAALLEYLGIPHTRTISWLILLGVDKARIKAILSSHEIATPNYQIFRSKTQALRPDMSFPLFVKSASFGEQHWNRASTLLSITWTSSQGRSNVFWVEIKSPALGRAIHRWS